MKTVILPIGLIVLALLLTILAIYFERTWRNYLQQRAEAKEAAAKANTPFDFDQALNSLKGNLPNLKEHLPSLTDNMTAITDSIPNLSSKVQSVLRRENEPNPHVEPFRQWVTTELAHEPELRIWLLDLPEFGFELLTTHIAEFCDEMNMDLTWLMERRMDVASELKEALQASIIDYCQACKKAVAVQGDAHTFAYYYNLTMKSNNQFEKELQSNLFAKLTDQGLATAPSASQLIQANSEEKQEQAIHSIQEAAAKDWIQFANILRNTVMPEGNGSPSANGAAKPNSNGSQADPSSQNGQRKNTGKDTGKESKKKKAGKDDTRIHEIPISQNGATA